MGNLLAGVLLAASLPAAVPTPQSLPAIVLHAPAATLHVQVATTELQRERGLMGVTRLAPHTGMLFVFPAEGPLVFWMKDTLVPLDMVFIGKDCVVSSVAANVPVVSTDTPNDRIPTRQGTGKYVLELPANEAARDGIRAGAHVGGIP